MIVPMRAKTKPSTVAFGPGQSVPVTLPPGASVIEFALTEAGPAMSTRPDVGIGADDLVQARRASVGDRARARAPSPRPPGAWCWKVRTGAVLVSARFGVLAAPDDLLPKTETVRLNVPRARPGGRTAAPDLDGEPAEVSTSQQPGGPPR
jgi:hypothetical protein